MEGHKKCAYKTTAKDLGDVSLILLQKVDLEEKLEAEDEMEDVDLEREWMS